ncbi:peptidoglycan DD-metalloendopeptidase family protein [Marinomonas ostreistagni]|uniref:peptidoglycan DD-metalloendopeptidase family protein n=1 Tax=Marinomonas ostreistagni TaxID=359209 RepID=UPI00194E6323|nr:peptidoglycan DD-metalloendopeptidase family protein [Marinomonas ostreistagni]MBM6551340.1 peptidoglycan DD-metalloendopeptidase family protein [Marinomonas ostreistagni]
MRLKKAFAKLGNSKKTLTKRLSALVVICLTLTGCAYDSFHYGAPRGSSGGGSSAQVRPVPSSGIHRVKSGDTLFSIAFSYGLDYRRVARINGINSPYTIYPNQKIRLTGAPKKASSTRQVAASSSATRAVTKSTSSKVNSAQKSVSTVKIPTAKVSNWQWPVSGAVKKGFSNAGVSSKGIDIKGKDAEHVKAAADGVVVYAGNGLIGYGNLVIVKHNEVYLSAYAYNERILVKEKQTVRMGDSLAVIGGKGTERPLLHFEVRRDGQPIDPLRVLPKK